MRRLAGFAVWPLVLVLFAGCGGGDDEPKKEEDKGPKCGELPACLDADGKADLGMCPDNIDFLCHQGCCIAKEPCKTDADCDLQIGTVACKDSSLLCACNVPKGLCFQSACGADADCPEGKLCNNGGCAVAPAAADLTAHILRPFWIARPGDKAKAGEQLGAQARDDKGNVDPAAKLVWTLAGDAFSLSGDELVAGDKAGTATLKLAVEGGKAAKEEARLWNLGPMPAGKVLRVSVADEGSRLPVAGDVVVVGLADQSTPAQAIVTPLVDGQVALDAVEFPCDIHVISKTHEPVSVMRLTPKGATADLLLTANLRHHAALDFGQDGALASTAVVENGDVLTGRVDYKGKGEAGLGLTSLGVGSDLLSFNLDAIIGPEVKRFFHPDAPSIVGDPDKQQELPGGVTFNFNSPVIDTYVLAAPPGRKILWSLAGRVEIASIGPQIAAIVAAVSGGVDVGKIVGALLPYLQGFYSQVVMDIEFGTKPSDPMKTLDLSPSVGLLLKSEIVPADLPKVGAGWADLMLVVAGAMMPDGQLVPLGISAGTDATGKKDDVLDGKVDGDTGTEGQQPLPLTAAPLHSGLRAGAGNFAVATAAIVMAGNGKREGGSIVLSEIGALKKSYSPGPFLPFAAGSTYGDKTRELKLAKVEGADFYRVIFNGDKSQRWQLFLPAAAVGAAIKVPDLTPWGGAADLGKDPKRAFIAAFQMRKTAGLEQVLAPGGVTDLVRQTKRTSFIDVHE